MVIPGGLTCSDEYVVQCTDDVLWKCAPETSIILLTSVTPVNPIKGKNVSDQYLIYQGDHFVS